MSPELSNTSKIENHLDIQQFSENEKMILNLLFTRKLKADIFEIVRSTAFEINEALDNNIVLMKTFRNTHISEVSTLRQIAEACRITEERFNELETLIYKTEIIKKYSSS